MHTMLTHLPARLVFLIAAIFVYALFGSPTPNHPGWVEAVIGALLVMAAGAGALTALQDNSLPLSLRLFCAYGLSVPLLRGVAQGYDPTIIARDVAAFLFLCLPLFYARLFRHDRCYSPALIGTVVILGIVFCLRALGPAYDYLPPSGELYYLTNAPTVLFTAIFMAGLSLSFLAARPLTERGILMGMAALGSVMLILWAMLLDVQRATVSAIIFSALAGLLAVFIRVPRRAILPLIILCALGLPFWPVFQDAGQAIARKTAMVGLNMRLEEMRAVITAIGGSPFTVLFGTGWGAKMASPAVGGVEVAFTHSLLSYLLLKTGLAGLLAAGAWLLTAGRLLFTILRNNLMTGLALGWALVIPVFLYASHKSLDFGLILLLIVVLADGRGSGVASAKTGV